MSFAHAGLYTATIFEPSGRTAPSVPVTIKQAGTNVLAIIYTDRTKATTAPNPVTTSAIGNLSFYTEPGLYDFSTLSGPAFTDDVPVDAADTGGANVVTSVATRTGDVVLTHADISGLGSAAVLDSTDFDPAGSATAVQAFAVAAIAGSNPAVSGTAGTSKSLSPSGVIVATGTIQPGTYLCIFQAIFNVFSSCWATMAVVGTGATFAGVTAPQSYCASAEENQGLLICVATVTAACALSFSATLSSGSGTALAASGYTLVKLA